MSDKTSEILELQPELQELSDPIQVMALKILGDLPFIRDPDNPDRRIRQVVKPRALGGKLLMLEESYGETPVGERRLIEVSIGDGGKFYYAYEPARKNIQVNNTDRNNFIREDFGENTNKTEDMLWYLGQLGKACDES